MEELPKANGFRDGDRIRGKDVRNGNRMLENRTRTKNLSLSPGTEITVIDHGSPSKRVEYTTVLLIWTCVKHGSHYVLPWPLHFISTPMRVHYLRNILTKIRKIINYKSIPETGFFSKSKHIVRLCLRGFLHYIVILVMRYVFLYSVRNGRGEFISKTQFCYWNDYLSCNKVKLLYLLLMRLKHVLDFRIKVESVSSSVFECLFMFEIKN